MGRFEDLSVGTGSTDFAGLSVVALGDAGYAAEDYAKGTAQNVSGFTGRKEQGFLCDEFEAKGEKIKGHLSRYYTG